MTTKKIAEHHENLAEALTDYHAAKGDESAQREATLRVKAHRKAISEHIADGALPCKCGAGAPHGMMQPLSKGRFEFEIGCLACPAKVRGGLLPRHAVEAWNESFGMQPGDQPS